MDPKPVVLAVGAWQAAANKSAKVCRMPTVAT
jgi:hypothetical protein